jgi:hypothetical protein
MAKVLVLHHSVYGHIEAILYAIDEGASHHGRNIAKVATQAVRPRRFRLWRPTFPLTETRG